MLAFTRLSRMGKARSQKNQVTIMFHLITQGSDTIKGLRIHRLEKEKGISFINNYQKDALLFPLAK